MSKKLIIRADASTRMGTGHVMRCIALAQEWQDQGGDVTFLSHCESETLRQRIIDEGFDFIPIEKLHPDPSDLNQALSVLKRLALCSMPYATTSHWLVVDGYHFTPDYQKAIREKGYKLLVIDDMAHLVHYNADILLNQNIHASSLHYSCDDDTVKLLGCEYVLLRREFLKYKDWKREIPDKAKKILITMGGSDPDNVTLKSIEAIKLFNDPSLEVKIVVGPLNLHVFELRNAMLHSPCSLLCVENANNMPELMAWADIAISAAGSTCWEMAFMELPMVLIVTGDNQKGIAACLDETGAANSLGWFSEVSVLNMSRFLNYMCQDHKMREMMSLQGNKLINGNGTSRVINVMKDVAN